MHPLMAKMVEDRKAAFDAGGVAVTIVEAAVLFEAGWDSLVDEVWTTHASESTVVQRLFERNGLDEAEARKRIKLAAVCDRTQPPLRCGGRQFWRPHCLGTDGEKFVEDASQRKG